MGHGAWGTGHEAVVVSEEIMRPSFQTLCATAIALMMVTGCGTTIRPRVGAGGSDQPPGIPAGDRLGPRMGPGNVADDAQPVVDEICRVSATRSGWIAIRYIRDEKNCPASTDPGNPYTVAVIERYFDKQVGTTMVVCADQTVPHGWVRESNQNVRTACEGARVRDGLPTVMSIRRVSARS